VLLLQPMNALALSVKEPQYGSLKIKGAGITIDFPKTWFQQGKSTEWSPQKKGTPLVGFKWTKIKSDWDDEKMLPKKGDFLGPFMIDLGWERGSLYIVNVHDRQSQFEIHTVITRQEAGLAYDFYAKAKNFSNLNAIDFVIQQIMHSGRLDTLKDYVSKDPKECGDIEWDCNINEEPFSDRTGCGCLIVPQKDVIFDN
jgi:hypothetical protein